MKSKNHFPKSWLIVFISLALAVFVAGCILRANDLDAPKTKPVTEKKAPVAAGIPVDGLVVRPGEVTNSLEVTGTLIANQQVDLVSELTRRIVRVNVKEGTHVKSGALLFQLDDADLQAQLQRLHQQEKLARLSEERLKDLLAHDAVALQDYDEALTSLKVLEAQVQELNVTIAKTRITAPFDGQVGMINVHPGAIVSTDTFLTGIEDNSTVKVEFSIPEKYTHLIAVGSTQKFTIASDEKKYSATVIAKAASLSKNTRTLLIRAVAANRDGKLLPGQSARLTLALNSSPDALSVSSQALVPASTGYTVFVAKHNLVTVVPVAIGQRSAGLVEIVSGLHSGDTVITSNLLRLTPGAEVQLVTIH